MRRNAYVPGTGAALWTADNGWLARYANNGAANPDHPLLQVDIATAEFEDFPHAETAPGGDQDGQPQPVRHVLYDDRQLLKGGRLRLVNRLGATPGPYDARVSGDQLLTDSGPQDRLQQRIGVRPLRRSARPESRVPGSYGGSGDGSPASSAAARSFGGSQFCRVVSFRSSISQASASILVTNISGA